MVVRCPLARPSAHPQPLFCSTAAAQAGRAACAMNASPTMAVAMAPVAPPGSVPVMRAGEAYSVTKVSQGREDAEGTGEMGKELGARIITWTLSTW